MKEIGRSLSGEKKKQGEVEESVGWAMEAYRWREYKTFQCNYSRDELCIAVYNFTASVA